MENIEIRWARLSDIDALVSFFLKSYGSETIFGDKDFLKYYFKLWDKNFGVFENNLIAINDNGEVVSHYGGLQYNIVFNNIKYSIIWGVNAYTLPLWRGKSINSRMLKLLQKSNKFNGVIGFTEDIARFYNSINYNIFDYTRFSRFVYVIDFDKTREIVKIVNNEDNLISWIPNLVSPKTDSNIDEIVVLTKENILDFSIDLFTQPNLLTTDRSSDFIQWRFLNNPYIDYSLHGFKVENRIVAYIVARVEIIKKMNISILRIIDLFGNYEGIEVLLQHIIENSKKENHIYIDFSMIGKIYRKLLTVLGFYQFDNEEYSVFPQVFDPIEKRTNNEYLGIHTESESNFLDSISINDVYFTRMDSDRDRIGRKPKV
jgi:hypothetical protein